MMLFSAINYVYKLYIAVNALGAKLTEGSACERSSKKWRWRSRRRGGCGCRADVAASSRRADSRLIRETSRVNVSWSSRYTFDIARSFISTLVIINPRLAPRRFPRSQRGWTPSHKFSAHHSSIASHIYSTITHAVHLDRYNAASRLRQRRGPVRSITGGSPFTVKAIAIPSRRVCRLVWATRHVGVYFRSSVRMGIALFRVQYTSRSAV